MQEMIRRIVDMDKKARDITTEAQTARVEAEKDIETRRARIHDELTRRARKRLKVNEETERAIAEEGWLAVKKQQETISQRLDQAFRQNEKKWLEEIVSRVLGA